MAEPGFCHGSAATGYSNDEDNFFPWCLLLLWISPFCACPLPEVDFLPWIFILIKSLLETRETVCFPRETRGILVLSPRAPTPRSMGWELLTGARSASLDFNSLQPSRARWSCRPFREGQPGGLRAGRPAERLQVAGWGWGGSELRAPTRVK